MGCFIINEDIESQIGSKIKLIFFLFLIAIFTLGWYVINVENIKASHGKLYLNMKFESNIS